MKEFDWIEDFDETEADEDCTLNVGDRVIPIYPYYNYDGPDGKTTRYEIPIQTYNIWISQEAPYSVNKISDDKFEIQGLRGYWFYIDEWAVFDKNIHKPL